MELDNTTIYTVLATFFTFLGAFIPRIWNTIFETKRSHLKSLQEQIFGIERRLKENDAKLKKTEERCDDLQRSLDQWRRNYWRLYQWASEVSSVYDITDPLPQPEDDNNDNLSHT